MNHTASVRNFARETDSAALPQADSLLEMLDRDEHTGAACAVLTPLIKSKLRAMQSGQILEVRVADSSARSDIEAWCRLSGNALLKVIEEESKLRCFVQKK